MLRDALFAALRFAWVVADPDRLARVDPAAAVGRLAPLLLAPGVAFAPGRFPRLVPGFAAVRLVGAAEARFAFTFAPPPAPLDRAAPLRARVVPLAVVVSVAIC